jgi:EAL domain-containing protein (putative c-di-GMP-specific phosphodiesterase class I)
MKGHVLIADDEPDLREVYSEVLLQEGHAVTTAANAEAGLQALSEEEFDLVVSDISMPGPTGLDFLRRVHQQDPDLPVILVTGEPSLNSAIEAVADGAIQYLLKPVSPDALNEAVQRGLEVHRKNLMRREALSFLQRQEEAGADIRDAGALLDRALRGLWMAYQPIVHARDGRVYGHEALVRSAERRLPDPAALFGAAERTSRVLELGQAVRAMVAQEISPGGATRFVNLHAADLQDERLYGVEEPLSRKAKHVILEITERAALAPVADLPSRLRELRGMGFRLAVDDLGDGYSSLRSFVALEPDVVKLDMPLVRGIEKEPVKRKLVSSMTVLCRELGVLVVAEGVETAAERDVLVDLGCDLLQGFLLGRPSVLAGEKV